MLCCIVNWLRLSTLIKENDDDDDDDDDAVFLTCAGESIAGVSWIALTPVAAGRITGTHVICQLSTGGVRMTVARCRRCALPRICIWICSVQYRHVSQQFDKDISAFTFSVE